FDAAASSFACSFVSLRLIVCTRIVIRRYYLTLMTSFVNLKTPPRVPKPIDCRRVDNVVVPIPHLGAIASWDHFQMPARLLRDAVVPSVISPASTMKTTRRTRRDVLQPLQREAIEFKSFKHPDYLLRNSFLQCSNQDR